MRTLTKRRRRVALKPHILRLDFKNCSGFQARLYPKATAGNTKFHAIRKYGYRNAKRFCERWLRKQIGIR